MAMAMLLMMGGDAQGLPRPGMRTGNAMGMVLYNTPKGTTTSPGFAAQRQQHSAAGRRRCRCRCRQSLSGNDEDDDDDDDDDNDKDNTGY